MGFDHAAILFQRASSRKKVMGLAPKAIISTAGNELSASRSELLSDLKSGAMLLADRGYDADWIKAFAGEHGAWANIPLKRNRRYPI
jgi:transposase